MAISGIPRIDQLYNGGAPIGPDETDRTAVSALQDLLNCHDYHKVRNAIGDSIASEAEPRGVYGKYTQRAVRAFRQRHGLGPADGNTVNQAVLRRLLSAPMDSPVFARIYVTYVLDRAWTNDLFAALQFTAAWEGGFAKLNLGAADQAGLSFGLLQWTQRSGRLHAVLNRFRNQQGAVYRQLFGGPSETAGNAPLSDGLWANTKKCADSTTECSEALDAAGHALDAAYKLNQDPAWIARFKYAGRDSRVLQKLQVDQALADLRRSLGLIRGYVDGLLHSQRALTFMLDLSNQRGDTGAKNHFLAAKTALGLPNPTEMQLLEKIETLAPFPHRRRFFRNLELLSLTNPFQEN